MAKNLDEIRNSIVKLGIPCEKLGSWLWVAQNNDAYGNLLPEYGFKYSKKHNAWYYKLSNAKQYTMDDLRKIYGSKVK